jgi:hypothetical protein
VCVGVWFGAWLGDYGYALMVHVKWSWQGEVEAVGVYLSPETSVPPNNIILIHLSTADTINK